MATATGYSAGRVFLQVVPSYRNFMSALRRDARGPLGKAIADTFAKDLESRGVGVGEKYGEAVSKGVQKRLKGDAFTRDVKNSIGKAIESLGGTSEAAAKRLSTLRRELDDGSKSANQIKRELDQLGESLHRVGQNDGNVQVATNARRAAEAILGTTEVSRRYREESNRTARDVAQAARDSSRAAAEHERAEKKRNAAVRDGATGNNIAARSLFSLRDALTGVRGDSNDGANAFRFFNGALLAAIALGPALIPVLAAIGGGLALLLPLLLGVGAGAGVAILGFSGIAGAVKALGDQQRATAGDSVAFQNTMRSAARQVADARRGLADAYRNSGERIASALEQQGEAERSLAEAQRDARRAQVELTEARVEARREQEDLANQIAQNQLDERQGVIDLFNAYNQYGAVMADGGSTNLEREQADIALKQAQLNLKRIREEQKRLAEQKKKNDRDGIRGSDGVRRAEERLRNALERVHDAQLRLQKSTRDVARARADGARMVADAQRNLTRAQEDYNTAAAGGAATVDKLNEAMDKLSPAGQRFARFIFSLRDGFDRLRRGAQERFLPGVQDGLERIIGHYGPGFRRWVNGMASDLGDLSREAGKTFTSSVYDRFFKAFGPASRQFSTDFGNTVMSLLTGFVGIMDVALPYARRFSRYIAETAANFAAWTTSEEGRGRIRAFFEYIDGVAPRVRDFFKAFLGFVVALAVALAPIGESVMSFLTDWLNSISRVDPGVLTLIAGGIAAIILALQVSSGLVAFISLLGIIAGSPVLIAVAAIGALAGAFYFLSRSGGETGKKFDRLMKTLRPTLKIFREIFDMVKKRLVKTFRDDLVPALRQVWQSIEKNLLPAFERFWPVLRPIIKVLLWVLGELLGGFIRGIADIVVGVIKVLSGLMDFLTGVFTGNWGLAWDGIKQIVSGAVQVIWGVLQVLPIRLLKYLGKALGRIGSLFGRIFTKLIPGLVRRGVSGLWFIITNPLKLISAYFTFWKDDILGTLGKLADKIPGVLGKIAGYFGKKLGNGIITVVDLVFNKALIGGINKVAGFVGLKGKEGKGILGKIPLPEKFARGGVYGVRPGYTPGRDNHLINVGGGEGIIRPEATKVLGRGTIDSLNHAAIRGGTHAVRKVLGFAKGGIFWPTNTRALSPDYRGHTGVDIRAHHGAPVYAAAPGTVTAANRWNHSYGFHHRVRGFDGVETIYAHMSRLLGRIGRIVLGGQQIGNVGNTGNSSGPHLHFEVRPGATRAAALAYLNNGRIPKGGKSVGDLLGGLGKGAISILKNPESFFKKRVLGGFRKVGGAIGGAQSKMLKKIPTKLLGGIVQWVKDKAMSVLGVGKNFFKYTPLGLGISGVRKGLDLVGKVPGIGNPFGGRGPLKYDRGGALQPGMSMVYNGTRRPEQILTDKQWRSLIDSRGQAGDAYDIKAYGADPKKVVDDLFHRMQRERRRVKRSGDASRKVAP